jgi:hypothetical protein
VIPWGLGVAAWCGHTPESSEFAEDVQFAFTDIGMKQVTAASMMRLPGPEELSRQLAGKLPLNLWRLGYLPVEFHVALMKRRAKRIGGAFLTADDIALVKGFAGIGPRQARMVLDEDVQERKRA